MRRAVFLDRDGVINRSLIRDGKPYAPLTLADVDIVPGVPDALQQLRRAGFLLIVVTNQPDVIRRQGSRREIDAIHEHMRQTLPIDDSRVCYHDDPAGCACRKPSPGNTLPHAGNAAHLVHRCLALLAPVYAMTKGWPISGGGCTGDPEASSGSVAGVDS